MMRYAWVTGLLLVAGGCVERRYVIYSDPPGAMVYRNGQPIGPTPADDSFVYYGKYNFELVKDGYETLNITENITPPWYEYPGIDFFAENLYPFKERDVRRLYYQLKPLANVRPDDVLERGRLLRDRGQTVVPLPDALQPPPPPRPGTPPKPPAPPQAPELPAPRSLPLGAPVPAEEPSR